jgi:hypothetical protein
MKKGNSLSLLAAFMGLSFGLIGTNRLFSKEQEMTPEQVIAAHTKSIGPNDVLSGLKNRGIRGKTTVNFMLGGIGKMTGRAAIVSAGRNMAIRLIYGGLEYPEEYFTFNGVEVQIRNISPGQRSPLGDFLFRYNQLMKEGLLGGVYSLSWPLLDAEQKKFTLKYDQAKIEGRKLHQLEYIAKAGMNDVKVKLFFDPETFRHVRTEYRLIVRGEQALQAGANVTRGAADPITREAGIQEPIMDSNYLLVEKFDEFKEIDKMTLPQRYTIEYSILGQGSSFLANWTIQAEQWVHNGKIDSSFMQ